MRVLITNAELATRSGTTLYVRDVAVALLARGHAPVAYSPVLGEVAEELRAAGIPVAADPGSIAEPPDVIHGQQHPETMAALLGFPGVPAVFFCHDFAWWGSEPPRHPRLLRHVAVDAACRDRLVQQHGVPPDRVELLLNFVDLRRFRVRPPLPPRPRRALVLSNYATERTHLPAVRAACAAAGIEVDVAGLASGRPAREPETLLAGYDLVFAKGRAALEAMAVGTAVVLCDAGGAGPLVTAAGFDALRPLNFGRRALRAPPVPEALAAEIARYDPADAAEVSSLVRACAGLDLAVDQLLDIYDGAIREARDRPADPAAEARAAAAYLHAQIPRLHGYHALRVAARKAFGLPLIGRAGRALAGLRRGGEEVLRIVDA